MGLEWHDRRRDLGGKFALADENYNLHLHVRGETYDLLRQMALERCMTMSALVDMLIWQYKEQGGDHQKISRRVGRGVFGENVKN